MAVVWEYGQKEPGYVGCVVDTYEHNGYHDSYWYARCWDREKKEIVEVEYDTTAAASCGWAKIDATEEVLREMYRELKKATTSFFDSTGNQNQAKEVKKGDEVVVVRGRKVPKGTTGKVFWVGKRYNFYSYSDEERVGIEFEGEKKFLPLEYVEKLNWENSLIHGKERKQYIRRRTISKMPAWTRGMFA